MSTARATRSQNETSIRRRFEIYRRYAEVVARQARALDDEDFEQFDHLAGARAELQDALEDTENVALDMSDEEVRSLVSQARVELQRAAEVDAAMSARLGRMRRKTADDINGAERLEPKLRRYLEEDEPAGIRSRRIDIKF